MTQSYTKAENAAYMRKWRADNPDKVRAIQRKCYANRTTEQKEKDRSRSRESYHKHKDQQRAYYFSSKRQAHLKHKYGISPEKFAAMELSQGGMCAICFRSPGLRALDVDHDHITGRVRGLLCWNCNTLLGRANDSVGILESAIAYLNNNPNLEEQS